MTDRMWAFRSPWRTWRATPSPSTSGRSVSKRSAHATLASGSTTEAVEYRENGHAPWTAGHPIRSPRVKSLLSEALSGRGLEHGGAAGRLGHTGESRCSMVSCCGVTGVSSCPLGGSGRCGRSGFPSCVGPRGRRPQRRPPETRGPQWTQPNASACIRLETYALVHERQAEGTASPGGGETVGSARWVDGDEEMPDGSFT